LEKKKVACIFIEACSNPKGFMPDWSLLRKGKHKLVVDNTWLSPLVFNPFKVGVDVVIDSCSKYLSGGHIICGAVNFKNLDDLVSQVTEELTFTGVHVSEEYCNLLISSVGSIRDRISVSYAKTRAVLEFLSSRKEVLKIFHPSLSSHPSNETFSQLISCYGPSVLWFNLSAGKNYPGPLEGWDIRIKNLLNKYSIPMRTSFGGEEDRINTHPIRDENNNVWLRIALGYSNPDSSSFISNLSSFLDEYKSSEV